jgi:7,8-dihydropterin-6-yl-methyl-4-(beta-D-ribofuranosyl)aminobenzene 5'-phosphate synthase
VFVSVQAHAQDQVNSSSHFSRNVAQNLIKTPNPEIERLANAFHDKWKLDLIAPGHCTGEPAFALLRQIFGESYLYAGLGSIAEIDSDSSRRAWPRGLDQ